MSKPKIAVIIGSTRKARFADKPAAWLMEKVKDHPELDFELVDLRDYDLPFFDEAASNAWVPSQDPRAVRWQQKVAEFDGYLFVLAEYNHSMPASVKNAFDQDYVGWNRKPIGALAYGSMGGARSLEHLRNVAVELQMVPLRNAVHIGGSEFFKVWSGGQDEPISEIEGVLEGSLKGMLEELVWWTKATKAAREA
ncbi:NADPH-dependent FMN reductase [Paracoccus sp. MC1862]|uniref:NADPH-dependent FMN reductase n=1 Tax=Paracoccus sp. MC1862 TaxID=2760307 RepID=UPI0015FF6A5E|nr:NADPH-dependent FMN reductase [Paracoccus sp. MC1862]MBB1498225.1 NAD(P)H-dependent oxidoreductase [Paracoccus sp. MC1862]QQO45715.1 NAD(P)H-dependent oxidoreductase [Paracoccus sp. MC1862]